MSPVRGLGNLLIRAAFRLLIGPGTGDLLSGYRAFSPRFLQTVTLRSEGFEIETELAIEAVTRRLRTLEVSVPYRPRIAGTVSKLRAFRDGRRILKTILAQGLRRDPARVILVLLRPHHRPCSCRRSSCGGSSATGIRLECCGWSCCRRIPRADRGGRLDSS